MTLPAVLILYEKNTFKLFNWNFLFQLLVFLSAVNVSQPLLHTIRRATTAFTYSQCPEQPSWNFKLRYQHWEVGGVASAKSPIA